MCPEMPSGAMSIFEAFGICFFASPHGRRPSFSRQQKLYQMLLRGFTSRLTVSEVQGISSRLSQGYAPSRYQSGCKLPF